MTDQPFQPIPTDPAQQTTVPSQGGVFGGFVGVEEVVAPQIPDSSVLFGESNANEPALDTGIEVEPTFEGFHLPQDEPVVEEVIAPIEEVVAPVEEVVAPIEEPVAPIEEVLAPVEEVVAPIEEPVAPIEEVVAPIEEVVAPVEEVVAPVEEVVAPVEEPVAPVFVISDIKAKYNELANNIDMLNNGSEEAIEIVGSNTDSSHVEYRFTKEDDILEVTRVELTKESNESTENVIAFVADGEEGQIQVFLDDTLLFEEDELLEDAKKKMQVMEKFNKFIFLTAEKLKDVEKARKAQEAELQEKRRLQDIFRNF